MSSKRTKSNRGIVILFLVGSCGVAALGLYVKAGHDRVPTEDRKPEPVVARSETPKPVEAKKDSTAEATVLVPTMTGTELSFKTVSRPLPQGETPMVFAVNEYLHQIPAVPKDARLLSVEVINHVAIMQFNPVFGQNTYGSEDEKAVLDGLAATMGLFPDVNQIKLQVDGKDIDSLGHVELADPLPVIKLSKSSSAKPDGAKQQPPQN